jgi:hypothetical protein
MHVLYYRSFFKKSSILYSVATILPVGYC